jgi:hypothetical protein
MIAACELSRDRETGGIILGHYSPGLTTADVVDVTLAPPGSRGGGTWFTRGVRGLKSMLRRVWTRDGHYYLGEWHSHPSAPPTPSSVDIAQMAEIANDASYSCPNPVLLIIGGGPKTNWRVYTGVYFRDRAELIELSLDDAED